MSSNRAAGKEERPRSGSIQRRTPLQAHRIISLLLDIQLPVVAVVRGWAAGLGFQLALAADFTIAAHTARELSERWMTHWRAVLEAALEQGDG